MTKTNEASSQSYLLKEKGSFDQERARLLYQAQTLFSLEWGALKELGLAKPQRIFELGCGNGHYLAQWFRAYPRSIVGGVDRHQELLKLAAQELLNASLSCGNILDFDLLRESIEAFSPDIVILRFVLQHLTELECSRLLAFLAEQKMRKQFQLVLIDPDDSSYQFTPPCKELSLAVEGLIAKQAKNGGDRLRGSKLADLCEKAGMAPVSSGTVSLSNHTIGWDGIRSVLLPLWKQGASSEENFLIIQNWLETASKDFSAADLSCLIHVFLA